MDSKKLVICDREEGYASAFAHYLMKKDELAFQVRTCSDLSYVLSMQKDGKIDFLFISSDYPEDLRRKVEAGKIFVLTDGQEAVTSARETAVYKYQPGDRLLSELISQCSMLSETEGGILKNIGKKQCKVIAVYSPVHRVGKTSYALRLGKKLGREANVLYLGMETYGGASGYFPESTQNLADVLYYVRQEKGNLGLALTTIVKHMEGLDYIAPVQVSEDIKEVSSREWLSLIQKIMEQSIYEVLILDLDEGIRDIYSILRICTEIHMLTIDNPIAEAKIRQFEEELMLLGHEDIRRKIIRKEQKNDTGRAASCENTGRAGYVQRGRR